MEHAVADAGSCQLEGVGADGRWPPRGSSGGGRGGVVEARWCCRWWGRHLGSPLSGRWGRRRSTGGCGRSRTGRLWCGNPGRCRCDGRPRRRGGPRRRTCAGGRGRGRGTGRRTACVRMTASSSRSAAVAGEISVPSAELEHVAEGVLADQDGQQGPGALAVGGGGGRAAGHLDQGVVAALGRGAGQVGDGGGVAVEGLGRGPVGLEQLTFEAFELGADLGLGRGGELAGQQPGAAQAVVQGDLAVVAVGLVGVGVACPGGRGAASSRRPW